MLESIAKGLLPASNGESRKYVDRVDKTVKWGSPKSHLIFFKESENLSRVLYCGVEGDQYNAPESGSPVDGIANGVAHRARAASVR